VTAERRIGRHTDVVHAGEYLLAAVVQVGKKRAMRTCTPTRGIRVRSGVGLSVQAKNCLARERVVGVVKRFAMAETDDGTKDIAESLFGTDVPDSAHQVRVRLNQSRERMTVYADAAGHDVAVQPSENRVDDVRIELDFIPEVNAGSYGRTMAVKHGCEEMRRFHHLRTVFVTRWPGQKCS